jgi:hypothetical protein
MRKILAVCLVVFFSVSLLSSCSSGPALTQQTTTAQPAAQQKQVGIQTPMINPATHKLVAAAQTQGPVGTYSHANFPIEQTTNYLLSLRTPRNPGCTCGYSDNVPAEYAKKMTVAPLSVPNAVVNQPVTLRYDASQICLGQTIANQNGVNSPDPRAPDNPNLNLGTATWAEGIYNQSLPREWGEITFSYPQSGNYLATINITVECKDKPGNKGCPSTGYRGCSAEVTVPVTVH